MTRASVALTVAKTVENTIKPSCLCEKSAVQFYEATRIGHKIVISSIWSTGNYLLTQWENSTQTPASGVCHVYLL